MKSGKVSFLEKKLELIDSRAWGVFLRLFISFAHLLHSPSTLFFLSPTVLEAAESASDREW